jgi:hypothetical protein
MSSQQTHLVVAGTAARALIAGIHARPRSGTAVQVCKCDNVTCHKMSGGVRQWWQIPSQGLFLVREQL